MKPTILICFLLSLHILAFSQTGKLTGSVKDVETKTPLELATITVFGPDSSVVAYRLSDKDGLFAFDKLPLKKKLLVSVTYTGYASFTTNIQQDEARTDTLAVLLNLSLKDTVVVTAAIPVKMNGDTLEINPAAFKMNKDAVVEELLNQVSGITIWSDGSITMNGRKVQNLMVEGKPFMGSTDPRVATQNLPKSAIDKIQLYQEIDRSKINQQQPPDKPQDSLLTMNIKLKESSKKGYFGKAGVGYGTSDRFEGDISLQMYTKRSSGGIGGGINNINKNIGSLQDVFTNNTYRTWNPNLYNVGRFGSNGINKNHSIGGVYVHNFIENANSRQNNNLTLNYNKSGSDVYTTDKSFQSRTTIGNSQFTTDSGVSVNRSNKHDIGIKYYKTNSYSDNFDLNGSISTNRENGSSTRSAEVRDSADRLQSTNFTTTLNSQRSDYESLNFTYSQSDQEKPLGDFNAYLNASRNNSESEKNVESNFESLIDITKNAYNNRQYNTSNQSVNINGNIDYSGFKRLILGRYNLFGISLRLGQWANYSKYTDNNTVSDYDTLAKLRNFNEKLSYSNQREVIEYSPNISFSKNWSKWGGTYWRNMSINFKILDDIKIDKNKSSFANRNLDRSFQFLRYEGSVNFNGQRNDRYRFYGNVNYSKSFEYPSIDRLYTIVDDINAYEIRYGNPDLKNTINHSVNMNANFNTEKKNSLYSINGRIGGRYGVSLDPVTDSTINDPSGKRRYYYTNADQSTNYNFNVNFNISRKINKSQIQLQYNGDYRNGRQPNFIDGYSNISETGSLSNSFTLTYSIRSIVVLNLGQSFQHNNSRQTAPGLSPFKNTNQTSKLGINVNPIKGFSFSSTADRIGNSNVKTPIVLWNAFANYRFMQNQAELKFSAMDILKKYQNFSNSVNQYGTTTRITNGLQQYFLLTLSYYPRKFGKTELKKKQQSYEY